jgi:hypothetical protein
VRRITAWERLATFNAERDRGLVHTPAYVARMAAIQQRLDRAESALPNRDVVIGGPPPLPMVRLRSGPKVGG